MTNDTYQMHIDTILLDMSADTVKQVFQKLSAHVCKLIGTPEIFLLDSLLGREKHQNSGIGHAVAAVVACKLLATATPSLALGKTCRGYEFLDTTITSA